MAWEDWGQKVDLTARIREILLNYPEGTSILKELIQNADDARASCVRFCLDHRQHTTDQLLGPGMAAFQGPALLVYNDAVFSETDFQSISRIGDSLKKGQAGKTGRFGIGFNSCYHLTDVPSFVSGEYLAIFDPHCKHLPNISSTNPGKRINFVAATHTSSSSQPPADPAAKALGQLAPYQGVFGCDLLHGKPWQHTLFRFPLRSEAQAQISTISKQAYSPAKVCSLLLQLSIESHAILLFLKTVSTIEISEWVDGALQPTTLFTCHISNVRNQLATERTLFARASAALVAAHHAQGAAGDGAAAGQQARAVQTPAASASEQGSVFVLDIQMQHHTTWGASGAAAGATPGSEGSAVSKVAQDPTSLSAPSSSPSPPSVSTPGTTRRQYMISQLLGSGALVDLARELSKQFTVPLVPWAAVAADITSAAEHDTAAPTALPGQAYCFLPLPAFTGLPVHVNAFFELSSNRRDIWHGEDMAGVGAARAAWNKALLSEVAAEAYANLILHATRHLGPGPRFLSLWPSKNVSPPWQALLKSVFLKLTNKPVLHTAAAGGQWLLPENALLPDQACMGSTVLAGALESIGLPLAATTPALLAMWLEHLPSPPRYVTPDITRSHFQRSSLQSQALAVRDAATAAVVLDYCMATLSITGAAQAAQQLAGLRLLPMMDGRVAIIQDRQVPTRLFVPEEVELQLLRDTAPDLLVDCQQLSDDSVSRIWALTHLEATNITSITSKHMAQQFIPRLIKTDAGSGGVRWGDAPGCTITRERVVLLWKWLSQQSSLQDLTDCPVLPVLPSGGHSGSTSAAVGQHSASQEPQQQDGQQQQQLEAQQGDLVALGTTATSSVLCPTEQEMRLFDDYVNSSSSSSSTSSSSDQGVGTPSNYAISVSQAGVVNTNTAANSTKPVVIRILPSLSSLGVRVVDVRTFPGLPYNLLTQSHCQMLDAPGVLAALSNLGGPGLKAGLSQAPTRLCHELRGFVASRDCIQTVLGQRSAGVRQGHAQARPFNAQQMLSALAAMPIWRPPGGGDDGEGHQQASGGGSEQQEGAGHSQSVLVDLSGTCFLQPEGFDASLLSSRFKYVVADSAEQASVMCDYLGVKRMTVAQVYHQHVIPHLMSMPQQPRERLTAHLLRSLNSVLPSDPSLAPLLSALPLVPNSSGVLCAAGQLYDPRREDLRMLLDPDQCFPAPPFNGDDAVLDGLVLLGLRQVAGRDTVLQAARFVQQCAERADAVLSTSSGAAPTQAAAGPTAAGSAAAGSTAVGSAAAGPREGSGDDMAILAMARGKALLEFLELEADRLVEPTAHLTPPSTSTNFPAPGGHPHNTHRSQHTTSTSAAAPGGADFNPLDKAARKLGGLFAKVQGMLSKLGDEEEPSGVLPSDRQRHAAGGGGGPAGGGGGVGGEELAARRAAQEAVVKEQQEIRRFWNDLAAIRWCPVFNTPPESGLPWTSLAARAPVAAPAAVRPAADMWLSSASLHVLLGECRSSTLASGLSWSSPLNGTVLGQQLKALGEQHKDLGSGFEPQDTESREQTGRTGHHSSGGGMAGREEQHREHLAQKLAEVVPQLYRALGSLATPELQSACNLLTGAPCVWVGRGFAPAHKVAFQGSLDLSPWLYVLPSELAPFKQLLKQFGATESFSAQQCVSLLTDMYTASLPSGPPTTTKPTPPPATATATTTTAAAGTATGTAAGTAAGGALDGHQLGQAIAAVQALADLHVSGIGAAVIYVPDEKGCLARAGELAFNDAPWMDGAVTGLNAGPDALATRRFVHPKISNHVAERVGVASVRRLLLARASDSVTLSLVNRGGGSDAAEAFGQSEALTTRLRHIIQDYPEGPGVLLELLQNADDAGATQLRLMLDLTTYPSGSILAPSMTAMQGPALLAFNDATFSPADFSAIIRIGQDAKLSRPTSIGRFGLGFNAVYHLTDVPSFVSGEYLVLFDPHAKYLPGVSYAQPGLRFAFQRANLLAQFPDAFMPYTHFGCTLQEPYAGTLFRFPLRTPESAAQSDIKPGVACGPQEVLSLFESFGTYLPHALLFLKSVKAVEVMVKVPGYDTAQVLFSARAQPTSSTTATAATAPHQPLSTTGAQQLPGSSLQEPVMQFLKEAAAGTRGGQSQIQGIAKALSKMTWQSHPVGLGCLELQLRQNPDLLSYLKSAISTLNGLAHATTGAVSGTGTGAADGPAAAAGAAADHAHGGSGHITLHHQGSSLPLSDVISDVLIETQKWLVCNTLGGGAARDIAVQVAGSSGVKMIPWVGIAAQLPSSTTTATSTQAKFGTGDAAAVGGSVLNTKSGGQAYCFLPLPIKTKLPVHINAFFELSSNRRDIWYGGDMAGMGAQRAAWNAALLSDGLAPAYARTLVKASGELGPGDNLYRLFPPADLPEPWSHLSNAFYKLLSEQPLVWVSAHGGKWLPPPDVVLAGSVTANTHTAHVPQTLAALDLLIAEHLPLWLEQAILQLTPGAKPLTPFVARSHLASVLNKKGRAYIAQQLGRTDERLKLTAVKVQEDAGLVQGDVVKGGDHKGSATQSGQQDVPAKSPLLPAHVPAAASLLEYCLSDLQQLLVPGSNEQQSLQQQPGGGAGSVPSAGAAAGAAAKAAGAAAGAGKGAAATMTLDSRLKWLDGCPLLPLADGTLAELRTGPASTSPRPEYLLPCTPLEAELLSVLPGHTLRHDLPPALVAVLVQLAATGLINVQLVTPASLNAHVLPHLLPGSWKGRDLVDIMAEPDQPTNLSEDWLRLLWQFLAAYPEPAHVLHVSDWPVLPVKDGKLARCQSPSKVLHVGDWQEMLTQSLIHLGCLLVDTDILAGPSHVEHASAAALPAALPDQISPATSTAAATATGQLQQQQGRVQGGTGSAAPAPATAPVAPPVHAAAAAGAQVSVLSSAALQLVVQAPSLSGILKALKAIQDASESATGRANSIGQPQALGCPGASITSASMQRGGASGAGGVVAGSGARPGLRGGVNTRGGRHVWPSLEASAVRHLRGYLLQEKWFTGTSETLSPELIATLFSLPIYELYSCTISSLPVATGAAAAAGRTATTAAGGWSAASTAAGGAAPLGGGSSAGDGDSSATTTVAGSLTAPSSTAAQPTATTLPGMLTPASHFSNLEPASMYLPPDAPLEPQLLGLHVISQGQSVMKRTLDHSFVKCEDGSEARVLQQLGVRRMDMSDLLKLHVHDLVRAGCMPLPSLQLFLLRLLHNLHQAAADAQRVGAALSDEHNKLMGHLKSLPLFPVPGHSTTTSTPTTTPAAAAHHMVLPDMLRTPELLYDPRVTSLKQVLDPGTFFPAPPFDTDVLVLDMLQRLGMRDSVTLPVLVSACEALNREYQRLVTAQPQRSFLPGSPTPAWASHLLTRASAVLSHLDVVAKDVTVSSVVEPGTELSREARAELEAWKRLQQLVWCPVVLEPPEQGLPWPATGQPLLAAPRSMRPTSYAWLASHGMQLVDASGLTAAAGQRPLSPELCTALGWDQPPHPGIMCQQLTEMGRMYPLTSQLHQDASPPPAAAETAAPDPLSPPPHTPPTAITDTDADPTAAPVSSDQVVIDASGLDVASNTSTTAPTPPDATATTTTTTTTTGVSRSPDTAAVVEAAAAPQIHVNLALIEEGLHKLYKAIQDVCEGQGLDLVLLSFEQGNKPCIWVGQGLVPPSKAMLYPSAQWRPWLWSVPPAFREYTTLFSLLGVCEAPGPANFKAALLDMSLLAGGASLPSTQDLAAALALAEAMAESANQQGQTLGAGDVMLPDCQAIMRPASQLFFNDAEWLSTGDVLLSHPSLTHASAEVLGVRSLRYRQQHMNQAAGNAARGTTGSTSLPCLNPGLLGQMLGLKEADEVTADIVMAFLSDLVEVADVLGATHLNITLDQQQHACQSLLHPGLAQYQGPALCITLPGAEVTPGELGDLLAPGHVSPGNADTATAVKIRGQPVTHGMGLLLAFAISELPQVVSGPLTMMWDPAGRCLTRSAQEEAALGGAAAGPRAQIYKHVEGQLHRTFADQYGSVWGFAEGYDVRRGVKGTIIRLPLSHTRTSQSGHKPALGWSTASVAVVEEALSGWYRHAGHSLLFCRKLQAVMVRSITSITPPPPDTPAATTTTTTTTTTAAPTKVVKTLYQAALSWDPDHPRHTFGQPVQAAPQEPSKGALLGNRLLSAALGKMQAAAGAVGGALSKVQAAAGGPALLGGGRKAQALHETSLDLVSAVGDQPLANESWYVCTCLGEAPTTAQQPPTASSKDVLTAVAVCLSRDDEAGLKTLVPASGMYSLLPSLTKPLPGTTVTDSNARTTVVSPGQALCHLKFLVFGNFYWTRASHGQRRLVPLLSEEEAVGPTAGLATPAAVGAPSNNSAVQAGVASHQGSGQSGAAPVQAGGAFSSLISGPAMLLHPPPLGPNPSAVPTPIAAAAAAAAARQQHSQQQQHGPTQGMALSVASPGSALAGSAGAAGAGPGAVVGPRLDGVSLHMALRSGHNRRVIEQLGLTWVHALQALLDADSYHVAARAAQAAAAHGHAGAGQQRGGSSSSSSSRVVKGMVLDAAAVYGVMLPDLGPQVEVLQDVMSRTCVSRMYHAAVLYPVWRLRQGRYVHISQGYFLHAPPVTSGDNADTGSSQTGAAGAATAGTGAATGGAGGMAAAAGEVVPGPAAVWFMHQYMPVLDVPDHVLPHLKAAHVQQYQEITPDSVRTFLKHHTSRWQGVRVTPSSASSQPELLGRASSTSSSTSSTVYSQPYLHQQPHAAQLPPAVGQQNTWAVSVESLAELLTYCMSDITAKPKPPSDPHQQHQQIAASATHAAASSAQGAYQHGSYTAGDRAAAGAGSASGGVGQQGAIGSGLGGQGLEHLAPVLNVVQGFLSTVNDTMNRAIDTVLETANNTTGTLMQSGTGATAAGGSSRGGGQSGSGLESVWDEGKVRDCIGLPVPTVSGHIVALGTPPRVDTPQQRGPRPSTISALTSSEATSLLVMPPSCGQGAAKLLPPKAHTAVMHPAVFQALLGVQAKGGSARGSGGGSASGAHVSLFQSRVARDILNIQLYSFQDLSTHLAEVLTVGWSQPGLQPLIPGWDCPGISPPPPTITPPRATALGKVWDMGRDTGPTATWLSGLFELIQGLTTAAQQFGDARSKMSVSHLDGWALLPTLPQYPLPPAQQAARGTGTAEQEGAALLVHVAHRAVVVVLPSVAFVDGLPTAEAVATDGDGGGGGGGSAGGTAEWHGNVAHLLSRTSSPSWHLILRLLTQAGVPVLDPRFSEPATTLCQPQLEDVQGSVTTLIRKLRGTNQILASATGAAAGRAGAGGAGGAGAGNGSGGSGGGAGGGGGGGGGVAALGPTPHLYLDVSAWDEDTRKGLLNLLATQLNAHDLELDDVAFLQLLPIYPTLTGARISLVAPPQQSGQQPTTQPITQPAACSDTLLDILPGLRAALPAAHLSRMLVSSPQLIRLYEVLGVQQLTVGTLLGLVVLPILHQLPDLLKAGVLTYIKDHWSSLKDTPSLVMALGQCAFVTCEPADPHTALDTITITTTTTTIMNSISTTAATGASPPPTTATPGSNQPDVLKKPSELYDPLHSLYGVVYKGKGVFPSGQFAFPAWLTVLRGAGLIHKVTQDSFMTAAKYVEALGKQWLAAGSSSSATGGVGGGGGGGGAAGLSAHQMHVLRAAEALWTYLKLHSMELNGGDFFKRVSEVAFVPASVGIPGSRSSPTLVRYCDAASPKDWPLCWTVAPILAPADVSEVPAIMMQFFRVKSPPPAAVVLQHLARVGAGGGQEVLGSWPPDAPLQVEAAFGAIWDYLDAEGVRQEDVGRLRSTAFVPVANASQLVAPAHMCMRLKDDLAPLAYEVPAAYLNRVPLLRKLGCQEGPTAQWLLSLLEAQAAAASGHPLNANQRRAVIRALTALQALNSPEDQGAVREARAGRRLLVLTADGRLRWPGEVVVDSSADLGGSRLTGRIDTAHMVFAHPQLPRSTAVWLGCAALQDKVEEVLDTSVPLVHVDHVGSVELEACRALLTSSRFIDACYSMIQSHMHSVKGMEHLPVQQIAAALRTLASRLVFLAQLHTCIVLKDSQRNVTRANASSSRTRVFEFSCPRTVKHYIAEPPPGLPAAQLLAAAVSKVLKSPVTLPLQPLFTCPAEDIADLQPLLLPGGYDRGLELAGRAGEPGELLHPTDKALVTLKALRRYTAGELVAVSRAEVVAAATEAGLRGNLLRVVPPASTAAAEAALRRAAAVGGSGGGGGGSGNGGAGSGGDVLSVQASNAGEHSSLSSSSSAAAAADLCYAKVVADSAPSGVVPLYRVPLEVEPGVVLPILSVHVYSFRTPSSADETATSSASDVSTGAPTTSPTATNSSRTPAAAGQLTAATPATAQAQPPVPDMPARGAVVAGPVSSVEMMGAVRELLGAVGLQLDADQEELMRRCADLRLKLEESQGQLSQAKHSLTHQHEELERTRGKWECKICTLNEVNACYQKCGHMVCWDCGQNVRNGRCPVCRKQSDIMRLF